MAFGNTTDQKKLFTDELIDAIKTKKSNKEIIAVMQEIKDSKYLDLLHEPISIEIPTNTRTNNISNMLTFQGTFLDLAIFYYNKSLLGGQSSAQTIINFMLVEKEEQEKANNLTTQTIFTSLPWQSLFNYAKLTQDKRIIYTIYNNLFNFLVEIANQANCQDNFKVFLQNGADIMLLGPGATDVATESQKDKKSLISSVSTVKSSQKDTPIAALQTIEQFLKEKESMWENFAWGTGILDKPMKNFISSYGYSTLPSCFYKNLGATSWEKLNKEEKEILQTVIPTITEKPIELKPYTLDLYQAGMSPNKDKTESAIFVTFLCRTYLINIMSDLLSRRKKDEPMTLNEHEIKLLNKIDDSIHWIHLTLPTEGGEDKKNAITSTNEKYSEKDCQFLDKGKHHDNIFFLSKVLLQFSPSSKHENYKGMDEYKNLPESKWLEEYLSFPNFPNKHTIQGYLKVIEKIKLEKETIKTGKYISRYRNSPTPKRRESNELESPSVIEWDTKIHESITALANIGINFYLDKSQLLLLSLSERIDLANFLYTENRYGDAYKVLQEINEDDNTYIRLEGKPKALYLKLKPQISYQTFYGYALTELDKEQKKKWLQSTIELGNVFGNNDFAEVFITYAETEKSTPPNVLQAMEYYLKALKLLVEAEDFAESKATGLSNQILNFIKEETDSYKKQQLEKKFFLFIFTAYLTEAKHQNTKSKLYSQILNSLTSKETWDAISQKIIEDILNWAKTNYPNPSPTFAHYFQLEFLSGLIILDTSLLLCYADHLTDKNFSSAEPFKSDALTKRLLLLEVACQPMNDGVSEEEKQLHQVNQQKARTQLTELAKKNTVPELIFYTQICESIANCSSDWLNAAQGIHEFLNEKTNAEWTRWVQFIADAYQKQKTPAIAHAWLMIEVLQKRYNLTLGLSVAIHLDPAEEEILNSLPLNIPIVLINTAHSAPSAPVILPASTLIPATVAPPVTIVKQPVAENIANTREKIKSNPITTQYESEMLLTIMNINREQEINSCLDEIARLKETIKSQERLFRKEKQEITTEKTEHLAMFEQQKENLIKQLCEMSYGTVEHQQMCDAIKQLQEIISKIKNTQQENTPITHTKNKHPQSNNRQSNNRHFGVFDQGESEQKFHKISSHRSASLRKKNRKPPMF